SLATSKTFTLVPGLFSSKRSAASLYISTLSPVSACHKFSSTTPSFDVLFFPSELLPPHADKTNNVSINTKNQIFLIILPPFFLFNQQCKRCLFKQFT